MRFLKEYKEELREYDVCDLIDQFDITSADIVDRFHDRVEKWYNSLEEEYELEEDYWDETEEYSS